MIILWKIGQNKLNIDRNTALNLQEISRAAPVKSRQRALLVSGRTRLPFPKSAEMLWVRARGSTRVHKWEEPVITRLLRSNEDNILDSSGTLRWALGPEPCMFQFPPKNRSTLPPEEPESDTAHYYY